MPVALEYEDEDSLEVTMRKFYNRRGNAYTTLIGDKWVISDLLDLLTRQGWVIYTIEKRS